MVVECYWFFIQDKADELLSPNKRVHFEIDEEVDDEEMSDEKQIDTGIVCSVKMLSFISFYIFK